MLAHPWNRSAALAAALALLALGAPAIAAEDADSGDPTGWLGVTLQELDGPVAKALGLPAGEGALISGVEAKSPAAEAGLEEGDVVVSYGGKKVEDTGDLTQRVRATAPGQEVTVVVRRAGAEKNVKVKIGERKVDRKLRWVFPDAEKGEAPFVWKDDDGDGGVMWFGDQERAYLGVELDDLGEQLAAYFGVDEGRGALVREVVEDSPAEKAGLRAGDVITAIEGKSMDDSGDIRKFLGKAEEGDVVKVSIVRDKRSQSVEATLGKAPKMAYERLGMLPGGSEGLRFYRGELPPAAREHMDVLRRHLHEKDEGDLDELREELRELREELRELRGEMGEGRR
jgi:S1-C subfamily serine protease